MQAHRSPECTDSEEDGNARQFRQPTRRRPVAAPTQGSARRKRLARNQAVENEQVPELSEDLETDTPATGSLGSIVSNTAVAVEGLRKVRKNFQVSLLHPSFSVPLRSEQH